MDRALFIFILLQWSGSAVLSQTFSYPIQIDKLLTSHSYFSDSVKFNRSESTSIFHSIEGHDSIPDLGRQDANNQYPKYLETKDSLSKLPHALNLDEDQILDSLNSLFENDLRQYLDLEGINLNEPEVGVASSHKIAQENSLNIDLESDWVQVPIDLEFPDNWLEIEEMGQLEVKERFGSNLPHQDFLEKLEADNLAEFGKIGSFDSMNLEDNVEALKSKGLSLGEEYQFQSIEEVGLLELDDFDELNEEVLIEKGETYLMESDHGKTIRENLEQDHPVERARQQYIKQLESASNQDLLRKEIEEKSRQIATEEFGTRTAALKEAHQNLAKLKSRYSRIPSLDSIPEKKPNSYSNQPLKKRLIGGIQLIPLNSSQNLNVDIGLYFGYIFNPRLSVYFGGSYRFGFLSSEPFVTTQSVYGSRIFAQYKVFKGFSVLSEIDAIRFNSNQNNGSTLENRKWTNGFYIGVGKTIPIKPKINGKTLIMFNPFFDKSSDPFNTPITIRFLIETRPNKKNSRKVSLQKGQ